MNPKILFMTLGLTLSAGAQGSDYLVDLPLGAEAAAPESVTITLYGAPEGGEPLETHLLSADQWQLMERGTQRTLRARLSSDTAGALWGEVSLDGEAAEGRRRLRAAGDLRISGELHPEGGIRFADGSLQTRAVTIDSAAVERLLGGGSSCPPGSAIRAIDAQGNVTCETDDVGSSTGSGGGVTQVNSGEGLSGGPITSTGTLSLADGGVTTAKLADGAVTTAKVGDGAITRTKLAGGAVGAGQIDSDEVQRRVRGTCPLGYVLVGIEADGQVQCRGLYQMLPMRMETQVVDSSGNVGWYTSLALDNAGNPVISYYDVTNDHLKLARCTDSSCSSWNINKVDSDGDVGEYTSLALDGNGNPVISYYDWGNKDLKLARCQDPNCSSTPSIQVVDSSGDVGQYTSLALDRNGNPVISYFDYSGNLKLARCTNSSCSSRNINEVDSIGYVGMYTSLALDGAGNPVISYYDDTNGHLKLARCTDSSCSSWNINKVDSGDVGEYTSLALDGNGNPVISYYDWGNKDLKLARCQDPNCSSTPSIQVVDSSGDVGWYTSLALDNAGNPVISYYDATNYDLKLARCHDPDCTSATIEVVDSIGYVGSHTSLALDNAGNPVISYYDATNGDLKLAR